MVKTAAQKPKSKITHPNRIRQTRTISEKMIQQQQMGKMKKFSD